MNDLPLVSIIMPNYNGSKYVGDSIQSVIDQTYTNWELIIIDDNSSDSSRDIIKAYAAKDCRIKVAFLKQNVGPAVARNVGISAAQGEYIAFLDSDDIWSSIKLSQQVRFMENDKNMIISYSAFGFIDKNNNVLKHRIYYGGKITYKSLLRYDFIPTLTSMYRVDKNKSYFFPQFNFEPRHTRLFNNMKTIGQEDYALWLGILRESGLYAKGLTRVLAYYRIHDAQISRNKLQAALAHWLVLREIERLPFLMAVSNYVYYMAYGSIKSLRSRF